MFKKIEQLFLDLENWLIQKIDCEGNYDSTLPIEIYMMNMYPAEYTIYLLLQEYMENKAVKEGE